MASLTDLQSARSERETADLRFLYAPFQRRVEIVRRAETGGIERFRHLREPLLNGRLLERRRQAIYVSPDTSSASRMYGSSPIQ